MTTIGIYGTGVVAKRAVNRFLTAHIDGEKARFIFLVDETWETTHDRILDYAMEEHDSLCLVATGDEFVEDAKADDIPVQESDDPYNDFLDILKADGGDLVLLWEDDNEESETALTAMAADAHEASLKVYDLVHGMRELEMAEDAETEPEVEETGDEPEEEEDPYAEFLDALDAAETPDELLDTFLVKENRDHLVALGEAIGADFKPNAWQKRIAPAIHNHLLNLFELSGPDADIRSIIAESSEPTIAAPFEGVPEEVAAGPDPETAEAVAEVKTELVEETIKTEPAAPVAVFTTTEDADHDRLALAEVYARQDLVHDLASVAAGQGVDAAKEFYAYLKAEGLT